MHIGKKVLYGSGMRVVSFGANAIVGFLLMPFIVHSLGDRLFGYWTLAGTLLGYYGLIDLGIVSAVQFFVAKALGEKDQESASRTVSTVLVYFSLAGLIIFAVAFFVGVLSRTFIADAHEARLFQRVVWITGFGFMLGFPGRTFIGVITAHLRLDLFSMVNIGVLLFRAGSIIYLLKAGYGIVGLAIVNVAVEILGYSVYFLITKRIFKELRLSIRLASFNELRRILGYSIFTFLIKTSDQLRFYFHSIIISGFIGVAAVTHYTIGSRMAIYFMDFMIALLGILSAVFSRFLGKKDNETTVRIFLLGTKISAAVATFVATCLILYGRPFIRAWVGDSYADSYMILVIITVGIYCDVSQHPSVSYLFGVAKHHFLMITGLIEGVCILGLCLALVGKYGLVGVALGATIPMATMKLLVQPIYVTRNVGMSLKEYYLSLLFPTMLLHALAVLVPWILIFRGMIEANLWRLGLLVILQALIAMPVMYWSVFGREKTGKLLWSYLSTSKAD
jgi:O-antigen/teichoic acid export membrane protein